MKSPILFLIFNRPDTTAIVFEQIKIAAPSKLYIAADGPRSLKPNEVALCAQTREVVSKIDWDCEVKTLFRDNNLGCKIAVSSAIDWFFQNEEEGIILEDDILPSLDFFNFCDCMLDAYREDARVMMVTGMNYLDNPSQTPYFFSEYFNIWGWATWKRAWNFYDLDMSEWTQNTREEISYKFQGSYIADYFNWLFDSLHEKSIDTWDIQWVLSCLTNHGLCLTPYVNLVSNIGIQGAHSSGLTDSHFIEIKTFSKSMEKVDMLVMPRSDYDKNLFRVKSLPIVKKLRIKLILQKIGLWRVSSYIREHLISKRNC
jgi:hypothetical protein